MAAIAEKYVACKAYNATIDGYDADVIDGGYTLTCGSDEVTNTNSAGFHESVATIKKANLNFTAAWKVTSPGPSLVEGSVYAVVIDGGAGNPYFSGNVRFTSVGNPVLKMKAGVKLSLTGESEGSYTTTRPS